MLKHPSRFLVHLKAYVRNIAQREGSMAEGYLAEERCTFCSRYFGGTETIFNCLQRNEDDLIDGNLYLFNSGGCCLGNQQVIRFDSEIVHQAHRYVLLHADDMKGFCE